MGLSFAAPLALLGLIALPAIYYLLRVRPPPPQEIVFPPVRLLRELSPEKETPSRTPWPLLLLRLCVAALIAVALSGPLWSSASSLAAMDGPLLLAIDDGWPAAPTWDRRIAIAEELIETSERAGATVAIALASQGEQTPQLAAASTAREQLRAAHPQPYVPDRRRALGVLDGFLQDHKPKRVVWIADGVRQGDAEGFAQRMGVAARNGARVEIYTADRRPTALRAATNGAQSLNVEIVGGAGARRVEAVDRQGRIVALADATILPGGVGKATFDLPVDIRNDVALLHVSGEASAGAVALIDARSRVRRVAIVEAAGGNEAQPLLLATHYLEKALSPFAQISIPRANDENPLLAALHDRPNVLALADVGEISGEALDVLTRFVEDGGVLLRFAGPRLANAADDLIPVRLRKVSRVLGGAMSWETPKRLAAFERESPFFGLNAAPEVTVTRQVLAEPEQGLDAKTWARLADGTPLVTAERRGKGLLVLFHVSAETSWSNLPISGLFVDMLQRVCAMAGEGASGGDGAGTAPEVMAPLRTLNGFGVLGAPPPTAQPIESGFSGRADAAHPPGLYGAPDQARALQTLAPDDELSEMDYASLGVPLRGMESRAAIDLRPILLTLIFVLLLVDGAAMLFLAGALRLRHAALLLAALAAAPVAASHRAQAQTQTQTAQKSETAKAARAAALATRLAYVLSGDRRVDDMTRLGLEALSRTLNDRTSFSPAEPAGVDPGRDELAFYPMLYWPIVAGAPQPSPAALVKIAAYMKQGGTIVFDTRDALTYRPGEPASPETAWFREMAKGLDIPELEIVPRDHVITKTFYLIDNFVGRYDNGAVWVEAQAPEPADGAPRPVRVTDGVSSIVIVSNDLASAWAQDASGAPLAPLVPGGARQRELALRGGVNLVMYTLTGNYKSDQIHVHDLLRRLGQ